MLDRLETYDVRCMMMYCTPYTVKRYYVRIYVCWVKIIDDTIVHSLVHSFRLFNIYFPVSFDCIQSLDFVYILNEMLTKTNVRQPVV